MRDGGLERKLEGGDDFSRAIAKISVAQICENVGFHSSQQSALETLSEMVICYIRDLGKTANFYANLSGRMDCNVFDIIQGLQDLGSLQGFSGVLDVNLLGEITQYLILGEDIPFAQPIPHFPISRIMKPTPSFLQMGETPNGKHIPPWLPALPDPHTYIHTPMWNERTTDPRGDKIEQARQRRRAERSLLSLQQRLACNGSELPAILDPSTAGKAKHVEETNPFLSPPLQVGEKDGSRVLLPIKMPNKVVVDTHVSVLETFAPVIIAANCGICDSEDGGRKVLPNKRPIVNFKFRVGKKSLGIPLDLTLRNNGVGEEAFWFGRDDEKDEKKRRAERILKESMENPDELTQL